MISVILYGRNDSHGYNLHKRAAISINCIAEMLSDADDEILFVDYNTPDDLPTFIEAIYDTLTSKAKSRLRVLRVRPELHARMVERTHLSALEPHSRNIAIRRSNPRNRWILSTNTDMIFLGRENTASLADAVRDLPDGQYIVPRFELPEPLWESFPRTDPVAVMRACEELGPKLHLHEIAIRFPYMRFDSPGDFQLAPRQALFDIHGFDERMIHGWHSDSNMCKRLYLLYGERTESLADRVKAYHCDHTRVATLAHRLDIKLENNLQEFVYGIEDPVAHHQAETWGVPNEPIEELDFANDPAARFSCALEQSLGAAQVADYHSDANDLRNYVWYRQEHALPYVAGNLTVYPRTARFAYVGNNPRMLELTAQCIRAMKFEHELYPVADFTSEANAPSELLANYDLLIFDFGLDKTGLNLDNVRRVTDWPRDLRYSLGKVAGYLEKCADAADALSKARSPIADFLVLNANHHTFSQFMSQFLIAADTPYPTHVRKGRARVGEERLYRGASWKYAEDLMRSFFAYGEDDHSVATVGPGTVIGMSTAAKSARYKDGNWGAMDFTGSWIEGRKAAFVFAPPPDFAGDLVAYIRINEAYLSAEGDPMYFGVALDAEQLCRCTVYTRYEVTVCKVVLPSRLLKGNDVCRLEFEVENPQSADKYARQSGQQIIGEDPRELGVKIQKISFTSADRLRYSLGETVNFSESGEGAFHTNECWTQPDGYGIWTLGPDASFVLVLNQPVASPVLATFTITDVAVSDEHPLLDAAVSINGRKVAEWKLGPTRLNDERKVLLPEGFPTLDPVNISFHVPTPHAPLDLKWSTWDKRPLGFRLSGFRMDPAGSLKYRIGETIDLTDGGNSAAFVGDYLGTQWALPDNYGSWTVGGQSTIKVRFEEPATGALPASFIISDCMVSKSAPAMAVRVKASGRTLAEWDFKDREVHRRSLDLPADLLAGSQELMLTFDVATPRSPASLGWTADSRALGIRLASMAIGRGDLEMPAFGKKIAPHRSMVTRIIGLPGFAIHVARILWRKWNDR